jgi:UDP-3-O-[3-hydroxymyristoyl] N-acetylglucosamine deacetylase
LAACYGCGLDNAIIDVRGGEIPLLDGSAKPFIESIMGVGIERQPAKRKTIKITKTLQVEDGPRWVKVEPNDSLRLAVQTYFQPFGRLPWWEQDICRESFAGEIAPARTYGLLGEGLAAKLTTWFWRDPICLGVNSRNAISVWRGRVVTPGGLRYPDEYSRHRVVDWIGDLMLAGADFQAKFTCFSPTHHLARRTLEAIFSDRNAYELAD